MKEPSRAQEVAAGNPSSSPDVVHAEESCVISHYQSGALIRYSRRLASLASRASDPQDVFCFATAAILTAASAVEAVLAEFVSISDRSAFTRDFRRAGVAEKYEFIKALETGWRPPVKTEKGKVPSPNRLSGDHPDVSELVEHRKAIAHSEPDHPRSRNFGSRVSAEGARWAASTVEAFAKSIWGLSMPSWFLEYLSDADPRD